MNSFGEIFKIEIFGESHGSAVGILLDGVPAGIELYQTDFQEALSRRKPKSYGTPRKEDDEVEILSGLFNNRTTGMPILIMTKNNNIKKKDYSFIKDMPRPSHSDYVANIKYNGFNDYSGGGAFSGRLTFGLVCAGVVAKKIYNCDIKSEIAELNGISDNSKFKTILENAKENLDSVGGIIKIKINGVEVGLGEPYFDSFESILSHLLFSVPAIKGISFGSGFTGSALLGSEYNDVYLDKNGKTNSNNDGGINGGITNGNEIIINIAVKPTPSIGKIQKTYSFKENQIKDLEIKGRHDVAIILRMPVILESCCQIVLADLFLRRKCNVI